MALAYISMSRRQTADYVAVFEKPKKLVPYPSVGEVMSDFKRAT